MKEKFLKLIDEIKYEQREHRSSFIIFVLLRLIVILAMILQMINGNYENVFYCALTLLLLIVPSFIQATFKVELPTTLEIIILLFIFSAEILGEVNHFYMIFPYFDAILHTLNGFIAAAVGYSLVELLNNNPRLQFSLSPIFMVIVAFSFSMTIGVLWEFFEYFMDIVFLTDMQKDTIIHTISSANLDTVISNINSVSINGTDLGLGGYLDIGLIDTMNDLIVNFIGAAIFTFFGYFYAKNPDKYRSIKRFIPMRKKVHRC